jgi:hypothetical protein
VLLTRLQSEAYTVAYFFLVFFAGFAEFPKYLRRSALKSFPSDMATALSLLGYSQLAASRKSRRHSFEKYLKHGRCKGPNSRLSPKFSPTAKDIRVAPSEMVLNAPCQY